MKNLLYHFREFKEKCRRNLIRKLGGFSILPPDKDHIIIKSTTVAPTELFCKVPFSQQDLYDVTYADLEKSAKEKLRSHLFSQITYNDMIDFTSTQDEDTGEIEMRATIWLVKPRAMKKAKGEK